MIRDMEVLQPDCIVADSMAVWGKAMAMKLGFPFVSSTTTVAFNAHSAKILKQSPLELIKMLLYLQKIYGQVKRLQGKDSPVKIIPDIIQHDSETHTVVYTSPEFQPCAKTFSDRYAFVEPILRPAGWEFPKAVEKLIYIHGPSQQCAAFALS